MTSSAKSQTRIAAVQLACAQKPNLAAKIAEAAQMGADVVCLPELCTTQYFCQSEDPTLFDLAESADGPAVQHVAEAAKANGVVVIMPFFEQRAPGIYHNTIAVLERDGSCLGLYRKMHIPDDPGFYEKFYFTPGDLGFKSFQTSAGSIGTLICWDQWFPEAARLTAMQGASVLCYPTAIGWSPEEKAEQGEAQHDAWRTVQRGHAIANGVYLAAVNRVGFEPAPDGKSGIDFWGQSFICDPQGVVLAEASVDKEEIITADIDLTHLEAIRRIWPFWRDRRIDAFNDITSRWN